MKKPVSLRALEQRINRKLAKEYKRLCRSRRGREINNLGQYYIIDAYRNSVIDFHISEGRLANMAQELGVLADWEELAAK